MLDVRRKMKEKKLRATGYLLQAERREVFYVRA